MPHNESQLVAPVLQIVVGIGWLLTSRYIVRALRWFRPLVRAAARVWMRMVQGIHPASMVLGFFLILAAVLWVGRQAGKLNWQTEMSLLLIGLGSLILFSKFFQPPVSDEGP
ncbi:MAG: hypothetical protein GTO53_14575 [Planctomycetales bacterium]|nr:hypothetical protein [Planctomycetales bacterium]NIM10307.1 hypothetical protein [Planctomycetales bacterium]NIN09746.1 hypothetical protein [Planctomycetales bacterium]NIN78871.1 hypothetical protein [Planctomycetales bacterium]NIO36038.1 hypothetical protein [Planctomycetales bacterium]